jgi:hypothetical protein
MFELEQVVCNSAGYNLQLRTSTDGGSTFASGATDYTQGGGPQASFSPGGANAAQVLLTGAVGTVDENGVFGEIIFYDTANTTRFKRIESKLSYSVWNVTTSVDTYIGAARRNATADIDAVRFLWSGGVNFKGGKIRLFGWNE